MEEMYDYWLHNVPGIGNKTMEKLFSLFPSKELYYCKDLQRHSLDKILSAKQKQNLEESRKQWNLEKEWERLKEQKIQLLRKGTKDYPEGLEKIKDAPPILYLKGKKEILRKPAVAVIGARACSGYGKQMAKELGERLAKMGIVVVSGMARGIDGISQWSALEKGGESIGVLGNGVEICYPPENWPLYERLGKEGCLISENLPFTKPSAGLFPLRNRIISGLADMVVVVESREKSGTQITVDMALEQGKDVYAVPGRATDSLSRGCNKLIGQGAGIIVSVDEFLEEICPALNVKYEKKEEKVNVKLSGQERQIIKILGTEMKSMEDIYQEIKKEEETVTLEQVMESVLQLQMKYVLEEENGYYLCRNISVMQELESDYIC